MPQFSISKAAKLVGKSRTTLHRHIKKGTLSAVTDFDGNPAIDLTELIRVYGKVELEQSQDSVAERNTEQLATPPVEQVDTHQIQLLQLKLEAMERERDIERERRREAEARADAEREEKKQLLGIVEKQTLLLNPAPTPEPEEKPRRSFFRWRKE